MSKVLDFLYHISPDICAVILGGILVQWFFIRRANEAELIDFLIKELDELRSDALEYWNLDCGKEHEKGRARVLEQKIKGAIKVLSSDLTYYAKRYHKKWEHDKLLVEVNDACTGGGFEVASRASEPNRYIMVINTINRIKSELMRRKL